MERKESSMSKICWSAVVLAVVLGNSVVVGKPPDLPGDNDVRCREANPSCYCGQQAMYRLWELEVTGADEEQQSDEGEASRAEQSFRRVRETTQPLGMVRAQTY